MASKPSRQMAFQLSPADVVRGVSEITEYRRAGVALDAVPQLYRDQKRRDRIAALVQVIVDHPVVLLHPHKVKQVIAWRQEEGKPNKIQVTLA